MIRKRTIQLCMMLCMLLGLWIGFCQLARSQSDGLVLYYSFDDVNNLASDETGNNNGTNHGVTAIAGVAGMAANFETGDYMAFPQSGSLNSLSTATFSYWIKYEQQDETTVSIVISNGSDAAHQLGFFTYATSHTLQHKLGRIYNAVTSDMDYDATTPLEQQEWTFVTFVIEQNKIKSYKNGEFVSEADRGGMPISRPSYSWYLGYSNCKFKIKRWEEGVQG